MANGGILHRGYTYLVMLTGPGGSEKPLGGFTRVLDLTGLHQVGDVVLKRGMVNASNLWSWLNRARTNRTQAQQAVVINLRNPVGNPVQTWKLSNAVPKKYTGPTLSGRSSNNIAIEELELSHEGLVLVPTKPSGHGHK